jgi:hypothetical protein
VGTVQTSLTGAHEGRWCTSRRGNFSCERWENASSVLYSNSLPSYHLIQPEFARVGETGMDRMSYRYYGYLDLNMDLAEVQSGTTPLFLSQQALKRTEKSIQIELIDFMQKKLHNNEYTLEHLANDVPVFLNVLQATKIVAEFLSKRAIKCIIFFTGLRGTRILIYDAAFWRRVRVNREGDTGDAGAHLIRRYFGAEIMTSLDRTKYHASAYGKHTALKPDTIGHFFTRMFPIALQLPNGTAYSSNRPLASGLNEDLMHAISHFWQHLLETIPKKAPVLIFGNDQECTHPTRKQNTVANDKILEWFS